MASDSSPNAGDLSTAVIGAAMYVHDELGPGLFERLYAHCLADELRTRGLAVERELELPVLWRGKPLPAAYRLDMLVEHRLVVEVKTVAKLTELHDAQVRTYLRLTGCRLGLLLNFHTPRMRLGFRRVSPI